ncbi:docking protein 1b [Esox lucius]|uniref:Docking protein 1b n=1 Tax=Esox lucius TaxID=8010 RepID=A0AAY5K4T4_ESOLU|nr:docking protein 1b [Esox lucius]
MDSHIKEGQLYVQHQKFGKKWKKSWFVLYPASQNGIARLEFYDYSGGGASDKPNTKKLDKKIIRLSECISILPSMTEACPKDNMSAFCVETNDKTHVFAAEKSISTEWVEKMCEIAFGGGSGSHSSLPDSNGGQTDMQMAENLIYYSREEVNEFWVTVQRTDASERCGLSGTYWLKADKESLILKTSKNKANILVWPYKLLRRYGRDKVMFSFEAGRRCDSGPGNFTFETKQGNEIFVIVEQAIQSQKVLAEERHLSNQMTSLEFEPSPPLTQVRTSGGLVADSSSSNRDPDGDSSSGGSKPGSADGVFWRKEGDGGKSQVQNLKGRSLPEPPPLVIGVGGTPPRSPMSRGKGVGALMSQEELGSVYSEPADCIRAPSLSPGDNLYSDPVDTLKSPSPNAPIPVPRIRPVSDEGGVTGVGGRIQSNSQPEPLYSDLYDRVTLDLITRVGAVGLEGGGGKIHLQGGQAEATATSSTTRINMEHIYDEPEGRERVFLGTGFGVAPLYDKAQTDPQRRTKGSDAKDPPLQPNEGLNKLATDSYLVPPYGKQPQLQLPFHRGPGGVRWPPKPAPKPNVAALPRKEPVPLPLGKTGHGSSNNFNNNNSSGGEYKAGAGEEGSRRGRNSELYSKVSRYKTPSNAWYTHSGLPSPDIIYDNLGDI